MARLLSLSAGTVAMAVVTAAAAVAFAGAVAWAAGDEGSTFRGGAARTGSYSVKAPKSVPYVRWRFETGSFVRGSAAVFGDSIVFGSGDGFLYSLAAANGKLAWRFEAGRPIYSTPAIAGGVAYFTDHDGSLFALDAASGNLKWAKKQEKRLGREGWDYWHSSPAVVDGVVYYGSGDGTINAVKAESGDAVWSFKARGRIRSSPAVVNGVLYCGGWEGTLYALNAGDGTLKWKYKAGDAIQGAPAVGDGLVYITSRDCKLHAVDLATGTRKWAADFPGSWVLASPALAGDKIVAGSSDLQSVECFDSRTGQRLWSFDMQNNVLSAPIIVGDRVIACGWDGYVHVLDLETGKEVGFRSYVEGQIQSSPVPIDGAIFVGSDDHCMYRMQ